MNTKKSDIVSLKDLAEFIWLLEEKHDLLNFEINKVKVWQYLRFRIFQEIASKLGLFEQFHIKQTGFFQLLKAAPSLFFYSVFSNPITGNYKRDILIFSAGRKMNTGNKIVDIYTEYFVNELKSGSYEIIEELYINKHLTKELKNRKHQDYQMIRTFVLSRLSRYKFNENHDKFIALLEQEIKVLIGIDINLKRLFRNGYLEFKYNFDFYHKLLRKRRPKKVYMICSYGYKMALVAAAKDYGVESVEIQHGTMNKYHLGYSYPYADKIEYFPEKIYFFGEYWKDCMHFPIDDNNKIVYGFPYFQKQKRAFEDIRKKPWTILIISQGSIGNKLCEFLWKSREFLKDSQITYKLHPGEYDRWKTDYRDLKKLSELENVTVVDNNNNNLHSFLAESEFVIGVYSTAIYEALSFDCKVIVVDLPGTEYLEDLVKDNFVKLVSNPEELLMQLKSGDFKEFDSKLFFA